MFVDTGLLRDHVSKLREKRKTAIRLYESVLDIKNADLPACDYRYRTILRDIEQLIEYFDRMADLLSNVSDDAVELSQKIGNLIQDDADNTRYIVNDNFML